VSNKTNYTFSNKSTL